jgi:serine phosphatase RsbU (regulator of sigma subunit)
MGTGYTDKILEMKSKVISNRLNFLMLGTMFLLLIIIFIIQIFKYSEFRLNTGVVRIVILFLLSFINLVLANYGFQKISKYSLIFLPPIILIVGPTLMGFVEPESYTYYQYLLITASIIPQLLLSSEKEKFTYWFSITYYFILIMFIDLVLLKFQKQPLPIVKMIMDFYPFYILAHIAIFIFVNLGIYHLRKVTFRFEDRLNEKNEVFNIQNKELKAQREKIIEQKNIIEQHSQAVTDSINYASKIQQAVLQPIDFISEWGIDNFIYFKPKDIVSGDFYWGIKRNERIFIATADCTGHGVPGAFMCILGITSLNDIVNKSETIEANEVLNQLRDQVIKSLHQSTTKGGVKDGIEIALCALDLQKRNLQYSGAFRPLYLIRDNSLIQIDCDKMPIGIYDYMKTAFINHNIPLQTDDNIYLFTDGYIDQFGGPSKKTFRSNQFRDLLVEINHLPMIEQKEILENKFAEWKGNNNQVDDVLVIGLKLK